MGTLVHHRAASVRAEAARMFWEIVGTHCVCSDVHYPVPEFAPLAGGDWVHRIPRAPAALGVGLHNPIECPRAAHVQLRSPPSNAVTLRTARLMPSTAFFWGRTSTPEEEVEEEEEEEEEELLPSSEVVDKS